MPARHDHAQPFKPDATIRKIVLNKPPLDDPEAIRSQQPPRSPHIHQQPVLHDLQMVRLQKQTFMPMDVHKKLTASDVALLNGFLDH